MVVGVLVVEELPPVVEVVDFEALASALRAIDFALPVNISLSLNYPVSHHVRLHVVVLPVTAGVTCPFTWTTSRTT